MRLIEAYKENKDIFPERLYLYIDNILAEQIDKSNLILKYDGYEFIKIDDSSIYLTQPQIHWYNNSYNFFSEKITLIGYTGTYIGDDDGFYTYEVGDSNITGHIYVDIPITYDYMINLPDSLFLGRGKRDIPIIVPEYIMDLIITDVKEDLKKKNISGVKQ